MALLTFSIISFIEGRDEGSNLQHDVHISHHASVIRESVDSSEGRGGNFFVINLYITFSKRGQSGKGIVRVNNSKTVIPNAHTSPSVDAL